MHLFRSLLVSLVLLVALTMAGCQAVEVPMTSIDSSPDTLSSSLQDEESTAVSKDDLLVGDETIEDHMDILVPKRIQITAGETVLYANLFDNPTAESFIELLPITLDAFDRIGLVKSTHLPQRISDEEERTREYVRGAVFYWPEGPEVAFCYSDHLPETVVDIIHIGLIESGVEVFEEYTGEIHLSLVQTEIDE